LSRKNKQRKVALTLEQQLAALGARPVFADIAEPWMGAHVEPTIKAQLDWDRRQRDLQAAITYRDAKRMRDPGADVSGNFDISPYAVAKGHQVETAPKSLGKDLPKDSAFPRRITTQRMIDRYKAQGLLTKRQWRAGDRLWRIWRETGRDPSMIAGYSPDHVRGILDPDRKMIGRTDAVADWEDCRRIVGGLGFPVLVDVVIWDKSASDWAATKRTPARDCATVGMAFLRLGLDTLAAHFRY